MKKRTHQLVVTVRFDKPCTQEHALRSARDVIHGEHFPYQPDVDTDPGTLTIGGFKSLATAKSRASA